MPAGQAGAHAPAARGRGHGGVTAACRRSKRGPRAEPNRSARRSRGAGALDLDPSYLELRGARRRGVSSARSLAMSGRRSTADYLLFAVRGPAAQRWQPGSRRCRRAGMLPRHEVATIHGCRRSAKPPSLSFSIKLRLLATYGQKGLTHWTTRASQLARRRKDARSRLNTGTAGLLLGSPYMGDILQALVLGPDLARTASAALLASASSCPCSGVATTLAARHELRRPCLASGSSCLASPRSDRLNELASESLLRLVASCGAPAHRRRFNEPSASASSHRRGRVTSTPPARRRPARGASASRAKRGRRRQPASILLEARAGRRARRRRGVDHQRLRRRTHRARPSVRCPPRATPTAPAR